MAPRTSLAIAFRYFPVTASASSLALAAGGGHYAARELTERVAQPRRDGPVPSWQPTHLEGKLMGYGVVGSALLAGAIVLLRARGHFRD